MKTVLPFLTLLLLITGTVFGQRKVTVSAAQSDWVSIRRKPVAAPLVVWKSPEATRTTVSQPAFTVKACIQSGDTVLSYQFFVNGKATGGQQRGYKRVACGQEITTAIQLNPGPNEILVKATNVAGTTESASRIIIYQLEKSPSADVLAAPKKMALVLANTDYSKYPLKNPVNDAQLMKNQLESLGFSVTYKENLPLQALDTTISDFIKSFTGNNIGLVFYAGHGLMVNGENYLQPVDAALTREYEVRHKCYPMQQLIDGMEEANPNGTNLIFWDACRNNPYRSWQRGSNNQVYALKNPPTGTIIMYATKPGQPADDGDEQNGLFTSELARQMNKPNVDLYELRDLIELGLRNRGYNQRPYIEGDLRGKFYFNQGNQDPDNLKKE